MKTIETIILSILLALSSFGQKNSAIKTARVTYIANSGFMVQIGDTKMLFDGIFQNGMDMYLEPDQNTKELIRLAQAPFDDVKLVFVSNYHADHFDPYLTTQFLLHNKEAKLICPQQVINRLMIFVADYPKIKNQIIESTPISNQYDRFVSNGIEIISCNIKHCIPDYETLENIAYIVNVEGIKVFHTGDSSPETLNDLRGIRLADLKIDIAFLNDYYGLNKGAKKTNELVGSRYNVLMHFDKYITDNTLRGFVERSKLESKPIVFRMRNEVQDYYINDFIDPRFEPSVLSFSDDN